MKDVLSMLVELQSIDDSLKELSTSKKDLAKLEQQNKEALEIFDRILEEKSERIADNRRFYGEREVQLKEAESNIARSRSRLNAISSQKELTALNKELESAKRDTKMRNEELVKLLEELDGAEIDFKSKQVDRESVEAEMRDVENSRRQHIAKLEAGQGKLTGRRKQIAAALPRSLVGRYDRISRGREGRVVVDVLVRGECSACHMRTPPQVYIRLQRMESLESCSRCNRILIYKPGLEGDRVSSENAAVSE